ncbi:hypothetical protein VP01_688g1, partial [Puccinia sorghi]
NRLLAGGCQKVWRLKIIPQLGKPLASPRGVFHHLQAIPINAHSNGLPFLFFCWRFTIIHHKDNKTYILNAASLSSISWCQKFSFLTHPPITSSQWKQADQQGMKKMVTILTCHISTVPLDSPYFQIYFPLTFAEATCGQISCLLLIQFVFVFVFFLETDGGLSLLWSAEATCGQISCLLFIQFVFGRKHLWTIVLPFTPLFVSHFPLLMVSCLSWYLVSHSYDLVTPSRTCQGFPQLGDYLQPPQLCTFPIFQPIREVFQKSSNGHDTHSNPRELIIFFGAINCYTFKILSPDFKHIELNLLIAIWSQEGLRTKQVRHKSERKRNKEGEDEKQKIGYSGLRENEIDRNDQECPVVLKPPGNMCQGCPLSKLKISHPGERG